MIDVAGPQIDPNLFDSLYQPEKWSQEGDLIVRGAHFERSIFRNDYVGTEHILLSLLRDSKNLAAQFLERFYPVPITVIGVAAALKTVAGSGGCIDDASCVTINRLRLTNNANQLLITSQLVARRMGRSFVGSEHILFGVLTDRGSTAARALSKRVNLDRLQRDLDTAFGKR